MLPELGQVFVHLLAFNSDGSSGDGEESPFSSGVVSLDDGVETGGLLFPWLSSLVPIDR